MKFPNIEPSTIKQIRCAVYSYSQQLNSITEKNYGYDVVAKPYKFVFDKNINIIDVKYYCDHC